MSVLVVSSVCLDEMLADVGLTSLVLVQFEHCTFVLNAMSVAVVGVVELLLRLVVGITVVVCAVVVHGKHMPQVIEHTVRTCGNFDFFVQNPFFFHLSQNFAVLLLSLQSVIKVKFKLFLLT